MVRALPCLGSRPLVPGPNFDQSSIEFGTECTSFDRDAQNRSNLLEIRSNLLEFARNSIKLARNLCTFALKSAKYSPSRPLYIYIYIYIADKKPYLLRHSVPAGALLIEFLDRISRSFFSDRDPFSYRSLFTPPMDIGGYWLVSVSYTHLTLPTKRIV